MKTLKVILTLSLISFCALPLSHAEETQSTTIQIDPNCTKDIATCQQQALEKEKLRQRCAADPVWCEQRRAKLKQQQEERRLLKAQCEANPNQCDSLKQQFKQKKAEERKAAQQQWCDDNPEQCRQWEADLKAVKKQCQTLHGQLRQRYADRP